MLLETLAISALIATFCLVPRFFGRVREYSQILLLIGTGALLGIYFFDLLPDVIEVGGRSSLVIVLAVWAVYSVVHTFHLHHHQQEHCEHERTPREGGSGIAFLMISMVAHNLASGMFLALARGLSTSVEHGVFWAMLAHKGYEALSISLVLQERVRDSRRLGFMTAIYALSFPAGAAATSVAIGFLQGESHALLLRGIAVIVASVAAGSLLGCMIHDFVIPSFQQIRRRRMELGWIAFGLFVNWIFKSSL
jgi:zinc transporter ZupT